MPLNVMDAHFRSFQHKVLPELNRRGIAPIGMKSLGGDGKVVSEAGIPVDDALRYVLSLPIVTLVSGIDSEKVLAQNLKIVRDFRPLDAESMKAIEQKSAPIRRAMAASSSSRRRRCTTARSIGSSTGSRSRSPERCRIPIGDGGPIG